MSEESLRGIHWSFWLIGVLCLVWNLLGVQAYMAEFSADYLAALDDSRRALIEQRPAWATAAFAIAVWGGVLGCVLLLVKRAVAYYVFIASLAGVVVQMIYNLAIADSTAVYGPGEVSMVILIPAVAAFLIWYSRFSQSRGWIK